MREREIMWIGYQEGDVIVILFSLLRTEMVRERITLVSKGKEKGYAAILWTFQTLASAKIDCCSIVIMLALLV